MRHSRQTLAQPIEQAGNRLEDQTLSILCLHPRQISLVYTSTLVPQQVLAEPNPGSRGLPPCPARLILGLGPSQTD